MCAVFASAIALFAATLFSLTPITTFTFCWIFAKGSPAAAVLLPGSGGTFGGKLVVLELAIAMVLLVSAGLLGKSFYRLLNVEIGFQPDHLATVDVMAPDLLYPKDEQSVALGQQIVSRVSNLPGVRSAAIVSLLPVSTSGNTDWIRILGRPYNGEHNEISSRDVSAGYFTTHSGQATAGEILQRGR